MAKVQDVIVKEIWGFDPKNKRKIPLYTSKIAAGFPSPAEDFIDKTLDLNEFLIKHPSATFFVRVEGSSMIDAGIHPGDILIVDKSLEPHNNTIVIAVIDNGFTVKRFRKKKDKCYLVAENPEFKPIEISGDSTLEIWGVVTYVIHRV